MGFRFCGSHRGNCSSRKSPGEFRPWDVSQDLHRRHLLVLLSLSSALLCTVGYACLHRASRDESSNPEEEKWFNVLLRSVSQMVISSSVALSCKKSPFGPLNNLIVLLLIVSRRARITRETDNAKSSSFQAAISCALVIITDISFSLSPNVAASINVVTVYMMLPLITYIFVTLLAMQIGICSPTNDCLLK